MAKYVVQGGAPLKGVIETSAGKNAPVALLCASVLVRGKVTLRDMTQVEEVQRILEILQSIGVVYQWHDDTTVVIDSSGELALEDIDRHACEVTRSSLLLIGALADRASTYKLYRSGGCKLGERTIRPHLYALEQLGVHVKSEDTHYAVKNGTRNAADIVMYESGDTATENAIMAAVLAPGSTTIRFASANYMVQDLCRFLNAAGARIEGIGTTTLTIHGVDALADVAYSISPDPVDAMAWISLGVTTKSTLHVKNCPLDFLALELQKLEIMGQTVHIENERVGKNGFVRLADITVTPSELTALPDKLYGRPYPGLNIDNVPLFIPMLTQARGKTLVHDWCYENRAVYYAEFQKLGANVMLLDPHRALIEGPSQLVANDMHAPPALRPAMAILIGMIAAKGESTLDDIYVIERGYQDLIARLQSIGVLIQRID